MGQDVRNDSRVCRTPPGPMKDLTLYWKPNPVLVAASLTFILITSGLVYYWMLPKPFQIIQREDPILYTPHAVIAIDGDANFRDTALLEGWPGDGSPVNPFIIDGLEIDLDSDIGKCISIRNTRVSFTISNCNLTGEGGVWPYDSDTGIYLQNVSNVELVKNICNNIIYGIILEESDFNTVANNTCCNMARGISLTASESNSVVNNTCCNDQDGIQLFESNSNTVTNNTCNNNEFGIGIVDSHSNTVANNICNNNWRTGIGIVDSNSNTVTNNTCNYNRIGIILQDTHSNTLVNNIFMGNTDQSGVLLFFGFVGYTGFIVITLLGGIWIGPKLSRAVPRRE